MALRKSISLALLLLAASAAAFQLQPTCQPRRLDLCSRQHHHVPALHMRSSSSTSSTPVVADEMMAWLTRHGAALDGVSLETGGTAQGLGIMATRDLRIGHQALLVPRCAQLHADAEGLHAVSRELGRQAANVLSKHSEEGALAAALLSELSLLEGNACKWQRRDSEACVDTESLRNNYYGPYLESLPTLKELPQPAWMWEDGELLLVPLLVADAQALRQQIDTEYQELRKAGVTRPASGEVITEELWQYARALVMSRSLDIGVGLAMVPGIEAANHSNDALFEVFVDDEGELGGGAHSAVLLVDKDVAAGEEVFISYGHKSNQDLLLYYGFGL